MTYDPEIHHRRSIRWRGHDYSSPGAYFVTGCERYKRHIFGEVIEGEMHLNSIGEIVAGCWKWLGKHNSNVVLGEWIVMPNQIHGIIILTDHKIVGAHRDAPSGMGGTGTAPGIGLPNLQTGGSRTAPGVGLGHLHEGGSGITPGIEFGNLKKGGSASARDIELGNLQQGGSRTAPTKRKTLGRLIGAFKTVSTNRINAVQSTQGPTVWQRDFHDRVIRDNDEPEKIREYIRTNPLRWDTDPDR